MSYLLTGDPTRLLIINELQLPPRYRQLDSLSSNKCALIALYKLAVVQG